MRKSLLSFTLIAGLFLPIGAIYAQSAPTVTATCKDGTAFTGTKRSGACRGHGGVQSWGEATSPANAPSEPAPTTGQRAAPSPGGGAGQVWVNTATKVYHCPGDRWYGKTKHGSYMSEAQAQAQGGQAGPRKGLHLVKPIEGSRPPLSRPKPISIELARTEPVVACVGLASALLERPLGTCVRVDAFGTGGGDRPTIVHAYRVSADTVHSPTVLQRTGPEKNTLIRPSEAP